jgi:RNA polymerase sigma-70 factor (ECF subfamily)
LASDPSFPAAYARFLPPVRAKCRRLLGSSEAAEEVVQESFVRLWEAGPSLGPDADTRTVLAWLYRTSTRLALDALRRQKRSASSLEDEARLPCGLSLEDSLLARRIVTALAQSVASDALEAAVLCRVDGVSQLEAAEILGVSERTVRRLLDRFDAQAEQWRKELTS